MVKQIKEQVEILCQHVQCDDIDLEFVAMHAMHLSQLASLLSDDNRATEVSKRQKEFLHLLAI